jgi:hypothetical protein
MVSNKYCAEHPKNQTNLKCSQCDKLVCPLCMVHAPVGIRCREHGQAKRLPMYEIPFGMLLRGIAMGTFLALLGGIVYGVIYIFVMYDSLLFLLAFAGLGFMIGESIGIATNRKRGVKLQYVAGVSVLIAYFSFSVVVGSIIFSAGIGTFVGLAISVSRLK